MIEWLENEEFEKMLNEAVVAHFKTLFRDLPLGTEENHDKPQSE
jgi:hypothetical protein